MRRCIAAALSLGLAGCASVPRDEEVVDGSYNINQQLLNEELGAGAAGAIEPYRLAPTEAFRMPEPVRAAPPELPPGYAQRSLPPTTLCVRVIVDADGSVLRTEPLLAHSQCGAGAQSQHALLLQAAVAATSRWSFQPAAVCHFAAGSVPAASGDCSGAMQVETVPVTLAYAFTFEVEQGRATVRTQGGLR